MVFQPDLVWIKSRNHGYSHHIQDVIRGAGPLKDISSDGTWAEGTYNYGSVDSFDTNGFTVGSGGHSTYGRAQVNESGKTYAAWCWKAADTTTSYSASGSQLAADVRANTAAGFSIIKFTGTAGNAEVPHGLNEAPEMWIVKDTDAADHWWVYHKDIGTTKSFMLNRDSEAKTPSAWGYGSGTFFNNLAPTSSVINIGKLTNYFSGNVNIMYAFHSVDGYQKVGSYTGAGSSGLNVTTGFRPRWVMIKRTDSANYWTIFDSVRDTIDPYSYRLYPNTSDAESDGGSTTAISFSDTGFSMSTSAIGGSINQSGGTYIYLAIA